jgi:transposase-like protein
MPAERIGMRDVREVIRLKSSSVGVCDQLSRRTCLRQCKYLNNIVEQDHRRNRRIMRLVRPGLGFGSFHPARRTLAGFETMAMMRKGEKD